MRLLFAGTVCLVHAYQLSGFRRLEWIANIFSSAVAVKGFFVVSGFLIFMSAERSTSFGSYANKRVRRIYPAYFTVVALCAIGLVSASSMNAGHYFSSTWIRYVAANLTFMNFMQPSLPGVFDANKLDAVNGALWTLKIEVMFYFSVPYFIVLFHRFPRLPILLIFYCASVIYAELLTTAAYSTSSHLYMELARQLPGQLSYFLAGASLYYFLSLFERRIAYFLSFAAAVLAVNTVYPVPLLEPLALAIVVVFFGLFLYAGNFGKYGDFSYGVYIIHFPVIQVLLQTGWFRASPWYFLTTTIVITALGAIALWHLIEKHFLLRSSHYVATNRLTETSHNST